MNKSLNFNHLFYSITLFIICVCKGVNGVILIMMQNLEKVDASSDASKNTENVVLELKSEKDKMLVQDEIKEEPEEV